MLAVFLLLGCIVLDKTQTFEYDDFDDESYSYDEEKELDSSPGADLARVRRYPETTRGALNPEELKEIKGALKQIMVGRKIDDWDSDSSSTHLEMDTNQVTSLVDNYNSSTTTRIDYDDVTIKAITDYDTLTKDYESLTSRSNDYVTSSYDHLTRMSDSDVEKSPVIYENMTRYTPGSLRRVDVEEKKELQQFIGGLTDGDWDTTNSSLGVTRTPGRLLTTNILRQLRTSDNKTTVNFDIDKLLEIVANLTYDYYTNLTDQLNATLIRMSVPTCATPTTMEPTTTRPLDYFEIRSNLKGKCYVCGLEDKGIPYHAHCSDAFSGEFMSPAPQDPTAKRFLPKFKKNCWYEDINNFILNASMPRAMFGRWTGGCSVRWSDLSGIYTQRSCRNRRQPATGRHFASKRMAALELTLSHLDNGCVISPVASLLPLSRGISLYARFHACVCTGSFCNTSFRFDSDVWMTTIITLLTVIFLNFCD